MPGTATPWQDFTQKHPHPKLRSPQAGRVGWYAVAHMNRLSRRVPYSISDTGGVTSQGRPLLYGWEAF